MGRTYLPIITKRETAVVYLDDIFFLQQEQRRLHVHTGSYSYVFYRKLDDLMPIFTEEKFYRCHKSCVINFEKVVSMAAGVILFEDDAQITMGLVHFQPARRNFTQFVLEQQGCQRAEQGRITAEAESRCLKG